MKKNITNPSQEEAPRNRPPQRLQNDKQPQEGDIRKVEGDDQAVSDEAYEVEPENPVPEARLNEEQEKE